jgi:uncharacterized protein (DUF2141 family)
MRMLILSLALAAGPLPAATLVEGAPNSRPIVLGDDAAACAGQEPAVRLSVTGLKARSGYLRAELYPATRDDFLKPDRLLEAEGKPFRRAWLAVPLTGPVEICLRTPGPGTYAFSVVHLSEKRWKFDFRRDGAGFSNNPRIGMGKPPVEAVAVSLPSGRGRETIVLNYLQGLAFRPLKPAGGPGSATAGID